MIKTKGKGSGNYDEWLTGSLKDNPKEQVEFIKAALEEKDMPEVLLSAIGYVARAKGIKSLSKATGLNRENLYRMLSRGGNPGLKSLYLVLDALGFEISVELKNQN